MPVEKNILTRAIAERDALIFTLSQGGRTATEIGADPRIKLSAQRVAQILDKQRS